MHGSSGAYLTRLSQKKSGEGTPKPGSLKIPWNSSKQIARSSCTRTRSSEELSSLRKGRESAKTLSRTTSLIQRMQNRELLLFSAQQRSSGLGRERLS